MRRDDDEHAWKTENKGKQDEGDDRGGRVQDGSFDGEGDCGEGQ